MECDFEGKAVAATDGLAAPLEIFIHTEIYKARPEVFSVIHMHPPTIMLFSICGKPLLPLYGAYDPSSARLAIDGIPLFDRSILIRNPELGMQLARVMGRSKTCVMRGHGITTAGPSVEQAALYAIQLNELATINYQAQLLGDPEPISQEDHEEMRALRSLESSSVNGAPPSGGEAAIWEYFCRLTGS
jgi:L-fuculose-phosphate aldolase